MAEPNKLPVVRRADRPAVNDPKQAGVRHADRLIAQFLKKAGLGDGMAQGLGALAGSFAEGLAGQFAQLFEDKGGISTAAMQTAYKQLGRLHDVDKYVAAPPATVTHENGLIDKRTFEIVESKDRGGYAAKGSIAKKGHAVGQVFDKLGLDLGSFDGNIAEVLDFAGNAKKNLADRDSWITIVGQMAMAAFGQTGGVKEKVAAALGAGIDGVKTKALESPRVIDVEAHVVERTNNDAEKVGTKEPPKKAPSTSNTGSTSGAFAVRAALLSGLKNRDESVERTAGLVLSQVLRHLDVEPDKPTKRKLHGTIKRLLLDPKTIDDSTNVVALMDRCVTELTAKDPERAVLGELNDLMQKAIAQDPEFIANAGVQEAFGTLAADAISEIVAGELGHELPAGSRISEEVFASLKDLLPDAPQDAADVRDTANAEGAKTEGAKTEGAAELPPVDISPWDQDRPDIPQVLKDEAFKFVQNTGVVPSNHPKMQALTNALAEVIGAAVDPETQGVHPAAFALSMHQWLANHAGGNPKVLEGVKANLTSTLQAHGAVQQQYADAKARYDELQAAQTGSTQRGNTAPLERELEKLEGDIKLLESALGRGDKRLEGEIAMLQNDGFKRIAEFIVAGKWAGETPPSAQHAAAGGGGNGKVPPGGGNVPPGGGNVPPGGGPPNDPPPGGPKRERGMFDREGPTGHGILPGFNAGMRPEDDYNDKNLTIQQQRAIKCGEILADPSLTIEDKIFLFMMWFTAFTDQEREKKLEELVQMDREAARLGKLKDEKQSELKSLEGAREGDENRLVQATAKLERLEQMGGANPEQLDAAKAEVSQCQSHMAERDSAIRGVEHELSDLRAKNEKAPKSREMLFMEIERLNQLRDKIMNMARSIMENSNRAIEKIFR